MRGALPQVLYWLGVGLFSVMVWYFFNAIIQMPVGAFLAAALVATWFFPKPWRVLLPLALAAELASITPPLVVSAAICAPLVIFWLRGRVEVDLSFWFFILLAVSAAFQLALILALATYPWWKEIPWLVVGEAWLGITVVAILASLALPSLYNRLLYDRHFRTY